MNPKNPDYGAPGGGPAGQGRASRAFTLLELLVVLAIIGILAGIALPNLRAFKGDAVAAASRQMLDDIGRARQLAISQRTTVFMIFVPPNFWNDPAYNPPGWGGTDNLQKATNLFEKQYVGYTFVALRKMGDQPGAYSTNYLSKWRTLPEGSFIAPMKFPRIPQNPPVFITNFGAAVFPYRVVQLNFTRKIPFPAEDTPPNNNPLSSFVALPYIAFNYLGQLVDDNNNPLQINEYLPIGIGSVSVSRDPGTKLPRASIATITETPPGNITNAFNLVSIDWLTGRGRIERQEVR